MSSALWFYRQANVECGPVATDELLFLLQSGSVTASTSIREEGSPEWVLLRDTGLLRTPGKRAGKPDPASSPPAQFRQAPRNRSELKASEPGEQTKNLREPIPLPPIVSQPAFLRDHPVLIGLLAGILVLVLLVWLLQPIPEIAPGMANSGAGNGAADAGVEQSANEDASSRTSEPTPTSASTAGTDIADVGTAEKAEAITDADEPTEATVSNSAGTANSATATANGEGAEEMADSEKPAGVEDETSATAAATGLVIGDDDGSRFSVSAPGETTFFGLRGTGRRFSYVVDCSGSMQGAPLIRATEELIASIEKLPSYVEFQIVFFDDLVYQFPDSGFTTASKKTKEEAARFINSIRGGGGTNVKLGMQTTLSLRQKADTVFLLTDGAFDTDTPEFIKTLNKNKAVRVNTVAFLSNAGEALLKKIASENRGDYRFVP